MIMATKDSKGIKLPRNYNAVNAKFRRAGSMKHRNSNRGGTRNYMLDVSDELNIEYGCDLENTGTKSEKNYEQTEELE